MRLQRHQRMNATDFCTQQGGSRRGTCGPGVKTPPEALTLFSYARICPVKTLLKSLLVWFVLLAVPFQGYASATMLLCAPIATTSPMTGLPNTPTAPPATAHDHAQTSALQHADRCAGLSPHHSHTSDKGSASHDANGKCNSCSACFCGAAMVASHITHMPGEVQQLTFIPFDSGIVPAVDLALPERPPQASPT
jgi:hypothetical protein